MRKGIFTGSAEMSQTETGELCLAVSEQLIRLQEDPVDQGQCITTDSFAQFEMQIPR